MLQLLPNAPPPASLAHEAAVVACNLDVSEIPATNKRLETRVALVDPAGAGIAFFAFSRVRETQESFRGRQFVASSCGGDEPGTGWNSARPTIVAPASRNSDILLASAKPVVT